MNKAMDLEEKEVVITNHGQDEPKRGDEEEQVEKFEKSECRSPSCRNSSEAANEPRGHRPLTTDEVENGQGERAWVETEMNLLQRIPSSSLFIDPGPPPDGGIMAWTQAIMGHLVIFQSWGYIAGFGVFQTYYLTALDRSASDISWIGTMQIFLLFFVGTFSGRALDAGIFRPVFLSGLVLLVLGVFMTSICTQYWQLFLAQGLCTGLGNGLTFCPAMGIVATYFSKKRTIAMAFSACGGATGGIVFPIIVQQLLPKIGFGWTVRILGFVMVAISCLSFAFLRPRVPPRKSGSLVDWPAFKEPTYVLFIIGMWFNFWALYWAYFYIGAYGRSQVGMSYDTSITMLIVANAAGVPGRLVPAIVADYKFGALNTMTPLGMASGILLFGWIGIRSQGSLYAFAVLYGLFSNGIQGLWPATLSSLTTNVQKTGTRLGMGFTIVSFACLTGSPLGGALIQHDHGKYTYAQVWAGVSMICGGLVLVAARISKSGLVLRKRI